MDTPTGQRGRIGGDTILQVRDRSEADGIYPDGRSYEHKGEGDEMNMAPRKCLDLCTYADYRSKFYFHCNKFRKNYPMSAECYHCLYFHEKPDLRRLQDGTPVERTMEQLHQDHMRERWEDVKY
jgi:hypothetical protein